MQKIFIKYNPYQVKTEILIDGNVPKKNSRFNFGDRRLQEWVDDLPDILFEECSTRDFEITFHGTIPDYEDIVAMADEAKAKNINIKLEHIPAKEVKDKEAGIQEIFKMIQEGPFEELKKPDVVRTFELANSSDFEVNVVATMSAVYGVPAYSSQIRGKQKPVTGQQPTAAFPKRFTSGNSADYSAIIRNAANINRILRNNKSPQGDRTWSYLDIEAIQAAAKKINAACENIKSRRR